MPPPQLARDTPRADVLHPVQVDAAKALGREPHATVLDRGDRGIRELAHVAEPLERQQRLDAFAASVRERDVVGVLDLAAHSIDRAQVGDDLGAAFQRRQPGVPLAGKRRHATVLADDAELVQAVSARDLEVVGVVCGRHLERTRAERRIHVLVGNDRKLPPDQRQRHRAADQVRVALVGGADGDGGVTQHGLRSNGRDDDLTRPVAQRIRDRDERVGDLTVLDLEVRDRRAQTGVPVDHVSVAVDVALLVERHEDPHHGRGVSLVQRKALARVVQRAAQALLLVDDLAARLLLPRPHALKERLAPDLAPVDALGGEHLLDHRLCRDACVVGPADPFGLAPRHAVPPDQHVLHGVVERMAHVERTRDVGQRDRNDVRLAPAGRIATQRAGLQPARHPARLSLRGFKAVRGGTHPGNLPNRAATPTAAIRRPHRKQRVLRHARVVRFGFD